jgi:hypothetical protein
MSTGDGVTVGWLQTYEELPPFVMTPRLPSTIYMTAARWRRGSRRSLDFVARPAQSPIFSCTSALPSDQ